MSGHLKDSAVCLALLLFVAIPATAEEPPFPIEPDLTEPATLRYLYAPGSSLRYQVEVELEELIANMVTDRSSQRRLTGGFELAVGVRQQEPSDSTFIYEEIQNATISLEQDGSNSSDRRVLRALEGTIRGLQITPTGEIVDQEVSPLGNAGGFDHFVASIRQWVGLFTSARWSAEPVAVGDSWTAEDLLSPQRTESELEVTASATFTFLGYSRIEEMVAAVVELDLEVWHELPDGRSSPGIEGPALFRGVGHGYLVVDPTLGRVLHGVFNYGVVGQFGNPGQRSDVTRTSSISLQLLQD